MPDEKSENANPMRQEPRKTPLCEVHEQLGARMVDFAGWWMPVQYQGIREEHLHVRQQVGLFDVSHMGEIEFKGSKALQNLNRLVSNDVTKLIPGRAQYNLLLNFDGGIVDDVIVYCLKPDEHYLVCVNAANTEKDFEWMTQHNHGDEIINVSSDWAQIAVQGPNAFDIIGNVLPALTVKDLKPFEFKIGSWRGFEAIVARTGYTGEVGCEIFIRPDGAQELWNSLMRADSSVRAIGLGARDTLRTEMKYSLYGHEITDETNPFEARLGWAVKMDKDDFIGKPALEKIKSRGLVRELVGFVMESKLIPRSGYPIVDKAGASLGIVTSGTLSPSLNQPIGIGYVACSSSKPGSGIGVEIRGKVYEAKVSATPFVRTSLTKGV